MHKMSCLQSWKLIQFYTYFVIIHLQIHKHDSLHECECVYLMASRENMWGERSKYMRKEQITEGSKKANKALKEWKSWGTDTVSTKMVISEGELWMEAWKSGQMPYDWILKITASQYKGKRTKIEDKNWIDTDSLTSCCRYIPTSA